MIGAGALSKSVIGQLPRKAREIGPVAGVSYRVASRMRNALRAGYAVRGAEELGGVPSTMMAPAIPNCRASAVAAPIERNRSRIE
ncbi:MAG TPA: hypothetical protein VFT60_00070, partial [Bryobacteraceae bacterium]|nr:hypothetical protein [Bryobacteraceae bacterium]